MKDFRKAIDFKWPEKLMAMVILFEIVRALKV